MNNSLRAQLKVLGLDAAKDPLTFETVNRLYQELSKELHPDRHHGITADIKQQLSAKFSEVTEARNFFCDWWDCCSQSFDKKKLAELADAHYD